MTTVVAVEKENNSDADEVSVILAAVRGRVYQIANDGSWVRNPDGHYAVGSGPQSTQCIAAAGSNAKTAVEIASFFDSSTNDDVRVMKVKK